MITNRKIFFLYLFLFIGQVPLLYSQITIIVNSIPDNTPENASIYLAGNFNNWNPGDDNFILEKQNDNTYKVTLPSGSGVLEYKFTRGDWGSVEGGADGAEIENRTFTYGNDQTITNQILSWKDLENDGNSGNSTAAENVHIISETFDIPQLNRTRRIWIYLPPNYESTERHYGVIYMHDGQNLFDAATSFSGEWGIDETLNDLISEGDSASIIVGIDNGQNHRLDEYSPWVNTQYGGGEGDKYGQFLVETLKPYIDTHYRTLPGRKHTGVIGSSMGGLISFYLGLQYPDVFSRIGVFSPSFWFSDEVFTFAKNYKKNKSSRFYFLGGQLEGSQLIVDMQKMHNILKDVGFSDDELNLVVKEDGQHSEWFWKRDFPDAYKWLYNASSTVTKISNTNSKNGFKIFPNPFENTLNIRSEKGFENTIHVKVNSISGKHIKNIKLKANNHKKNFSINTKKWPAGTYILTFDTKDGSFTKKVLKKY